ncbi:MAG: amidohydrolase [Desulfobacterales bacterium]|nr:amidohydrolase [Desulfobacterales bacterium]
MEHQSKQRVLDFRCRPPLPEYGALFQIKLQYLVGRMKNTTNRGATATTASMSMMGKNGAMKQWWKEIDEAGIKAIVCNGRLSPELGSVDSDSLADLQKRYPGRFYGLAPVNLEQDIKLTVDECERAIKEHGLRGISIEPTIRKKGGPAQVDNQDFFPIYEAMAALDVPVMVTTGAMIGPNIGFPNDIVAFDKVLQQFKTLKLVLGHACYPNVHQALGVAFKHPNLYLCPDFYIFCPGGEGYQQNLTTLQDQFIFGSTYPFMTFKEPIEDTLKLPVTDQVMEKYLWGNAARLLKL